MRPVARRFRFFLGLLSLIYFCLGLVAFFYPTQFLALINAIPNLFGLFERVPEEVTSLSRFWTLGVATSLLLASALAFFSAANSPQPAILGLNIFQKLCHSGGAMYLFLHDHRYFIYFGITLLEGGLLIVLLVVFFITVFRNSLAHRLKKNDPIVTQV